MIISEGIKILNAVAFCEVYITLYFFKATNYVTAYYGQLALGMKPNWKCTGVFLENICTHQFVVILGWGQLQSSSREFGTRSWTHKWFPGSCYFIDTLGDQKN